jgi:hypothetical protein
LPLGFNINHPVYDTTRVEGLALMDANYASLSGQGADVIQYDIPVGAFGAVTVDVRVWYQSMPPRWVNPMFELQDSTILAFQAMFEAQGAAPELVAEQSISIPVTGSVDESSVRMHMFPNPTNDGRVQVVGPVHEGLWELYSPNGSRIQHGRLQPTMVLQLPEPSGTYIFQAHAAGQTWTQRIIRQAGTQR